MNSVALCLEENYYVFWIHFSFFLFQIFITLILIFFFLIFIIKKPDHGQLVIYAGALPVDLLRRYKISTISQPLIHLLSRVAHAINHLAYENTIIQTLLRFFSFFTYLKIILLLNCLNSRTPRYRFQLQWPWELLLFRMMTIKIR